jgi:hypothetical protein
MFLKTKGTSPRDYLKPRTKVRKIIILTSLTPAPPVKASPGHKPSILFTLRNMESGKPSNQSARGVDIPPTTGNLIFRTRIDMGEYVLHSGQEYGHVVALQTYVLHIGCAYGPIVACGGPDPRVGMIDKRLLWNDHWMFQACELGLPLQGYEI